MKLYMIILLAVFSLGYGIYQLDVQYEMLSDEYSTLYDNYSELRIQKQDIEERNSKLGNKIKNLESFSLDLTPSIFEVRDFLRTDSTNTKSYVFESYDCTQFAHEVVRNALAKGLFACVVEVDIENRGHMIVAFNTSERGIVYFEPQTDREVTLRVGKEYRTNNNNDTIIRWTSCF